MSPEQAKGDLGSLGPACDVYSLGATLYCLLTGRAPFEGNRAGAVLEKVRRGEFPKPRTVRPDVPKPLQAICLKAMALQPANRYATPRALSDDVERWLADEPVGAWREPWWRKARRWAKRNQSAVIGVAVALVAGVIGLGAATIVQARANFELRKAKSATDVALAKSEESRKQAEAVSAFLAESFRSPDPSQDGRNVCNNLASAYQNDGRLQRPTSPGASPNGPPRGNPSSACRVYPPRSLPGPE